jgi:hypothetical protein
MKKKDFRRRITSVKAEWVKGTTLKIVIEIDIEKAV